LAAIIEKIPPPSGNIDEPLQALILTRTTIRFVELKLFFVLKKQIKKGQKIKFMATGNEYFADEIGTLKLKSSETSDFSR
jgi:GTP-binding protein LepA